MESPWSVVFIWFLLVVYWIEINTCQIVVDYSI